MTINSKMRDLQNSEVSRILTKEKQEKKEEISPMTKALTDTEK